MRSPKRYRCLTATRFFMLAQATSCFEMQNPSRSLMYSRSGNMSDVPKQTGLLWGLVEVLSGSFFPQVSLTCGLATSCAIIPRLSPLFSFCDHPPSCIHTHKRYKGFVNLFSEHLSEERLLLGLRIIGSQE